MRSFPQDHARRAASPAEAMAGALSRRSLLGGAAAALAAGVLGGFQQSAYADALKHVSFVGWEGYDAGFHVGNFLAKHNATVDTTYINASEDMITKLRSGGMGIVDLTTFNQMYAPLMAEAGLIVPLKTDRLTNFNELLPKFKQMAFQSHGQCFGVPFTFSSCALLYNPKMVSAAPTSWKDFLKPEYKGKVALFSDALTNILVWAPVATGVKDPTLLTPDQLDQTIQLLITLKKDHVRAMPASLGDGADLLTRGEVAMIMGWEPMVLWCKAKGVDVSIAQPVEGTWGFVDTFNIAKQAPNLDLDYLFIDQVMSVDAQAKFGNDNFLGVTNGDAIAKLTPEVKALYGFDNLDAYFAHAHVYPRMYPAQSDGAHVSYEQVLDAYERFLKA
ncbi:ABC transporter substrate-binding protein [Acidisoma cellulosilyticum]|nr:extracellular solute-binding protein [Acidisoma cellulosilyticum]